MFNSKSIVQNGEESKVKFEEAFLNFESSTFFRPLVSKKFTAVPGP